MQDEDDRAEDYVLGLTNNRPHSTNAVVRHEATVRSLLLTRYIEWLRENGISCVNSQFNEIENIEWADWWDTYSVFLEMGIWDGIEQEEPGATLKKIVTLCKYE